MVIKTENDTIDITTINLMDHIIVLHEKLVFCSPIVSNDMMHRKLKDGLRLAQVYIPTHKQVFSFRGVI